MKKIIFIILLFTLVISLTGCVSDSTKTIDLSKLPWREFTVILKSGDVLTFCAVHAEVDISFKITGITFYNKEGNIIGSIIDEISSYSIDETKECK